MNWANVLVLLALSLLLALFGFGLTRDADEIPSPLVGSAAPAFELSALDGDSAVSMEEMRGGPVVVNFWASWCLGCIEEHPALVRAWRRFGGDGGLHMVGIVYQDSPPNARNYLRRYGGGWPQLLDPGSRTAIDYGVYGVPETFFVDRTGTVSHKHIGPVTDSILTAEIEKILVSEAEP